jgi:hypothetical protein
MDDKNLSVTSDLDTVPASLEIRSCSVSSEADGEVKPLEASSEMTSDDDVILLEDNSMTSEADDDVILLEDNSMTSEADDVTPPEASIVTSEANDDDVTPLEASSSVTSEADLQLLGVSAKSQADIEDSVFSLLELRERDNRVKQLKKNVAAQLNKRRSLKKQLDSCESSLQQLYSADPGGMKKRKISSLLNDQEKLKSDLQALEGEVRGGLEELERCNYDFSTDPAFASLIGGFWPNRKSRSAAGGGVVEDQPSPTETDQEKSIRLGEVTAFGNSLATISVQSSSNAFQSYLRHQIQVLDDAEEKRGKSASSSSSSSSKKRRKEEESSAASKRPTKRKKKEVLRADSDEDAWHTDDSDWEGTDDEEDGGRRHRRHFDDGDKDSYLERMEEWKAASQQGRMSIFIGTTVADPDP